MISPHSNHQSQGLMITKGGCKKSGLFVSNVYKDRNIKE